MSSLVKTEPESLSPNVSKLALEYSLDSCSESPVANNVLGLPDGQCIPYRQGAWTAAVKEHGKNSPPVVYVEGSPPPQYYAGPGYASAAANSVPPQGYRQGYYVQPQPVYYAPPPPPPNISRDVPTHRPGGRGRETVYNDDPFGETFDDRRVRARFIRKVYTILMFQLLVTSAFIAFLVLHEPTKRFVQHNMWVYFLSYAIFLVTYIAIVCCSSVRRQYPCNVITLSILTLSQSIMLGIMSSFHNTYIVLIAFGTTAVVCLLVSVFACQTSCDITGCGMYLCVAGMVIMLFGIIALFVALFTNFKLLILIYSGLIALLFSVYLMYDTQQIIGGHKVEISPEEHIYAVVQLYIDITLIFTAFLTLCGWGN